MAKKKMAKVVGGFKELKANADHKEKVAAMTDKYQAVNDRKKKKVAHFYQSCEATERLLRELGLSFEVVRDVDLETIDTKDSTYQTRDERILDDCVEEYGQDLASGATYRPCVYAVDLQDKNNIAKARKRVVAGFTRTEGAKNEGCTHADFAYVVLVEKDTHLQLLTDFSIRDNNENSGKRISGDNALRRHAMRIVKSLSDENIFYPTGQVLKSKCKGWANRLSLRGSKVDRLFEYVKQEFVLQDMASSCGLVEIGGNKTTLQNLYSFRQKNKYSDLLKAARSAIKQGIPGIAQTIAESYNRGDDCEKAIEKLDNAMNGLSTPGVVSPMPATAFALRSFNSFYANLRKAVNDPFSEATGLSKLHDDIKAMAEEMLPRLTARVNRERGISND